MSIQKFRFGVVVCFWVGVFMAIGISACRAEGVTVDLQRVALPDFLRVVYGELLRKSYVLDASVVSDSEPFSLVLRDMTDSKLEREVKRVLELRGYRIEQKDGVQVVRKGAQDIGDEEVFVYRPEHRAVAYLLPLLESLFRPGSFVSRRSVSPVTFNQVSGMQVAGMAVPGQPGQPPGQMQPYPGQMSPMVDMGLNAQLQVDQDVLVFKGSARELERFKRLVAQVDVPVGELLVKAVVFEVRRGESRGSAVDLLASVLKGRLGLTLSGGAASLGSNVSLKFSSAGVDFSAVYAALDSDQRFKVLTSPRLRVKSGSSARFSVGDETPVLGSVSYDNNGRPIQNVQYKPSGVIFELKPNIRAQSSELSVTQQLSQFVSTTNGVNDSPTLIKRELHTDVLAADGDLILLGGLDEEKSTVNGAGLSFLPAFLRSKSDVESKTEIVLMLHVERI